MLPSAIYSLLQPSAPHDPELLLRSTWTPSNTNKDLLLVGMNLKAMPANPDECKKILDSKGTTCLRIPFYITYVQKVDKTFGWSKAPYEKTTQSNKQKQNYENLQPLYTTDENGTRVWTFDKVTNPMNKGPRSSEDQSFVVPTATVFSFFLRPEFFTSDIQLLDNTTQEIPEMSYMILRVSTVNKDQSNLGYGLKLRQIQMIRPEIMGGFMSGFKSQIQDLTLHCEAAEEIGPLMKTVSSMAKRSPLLLSVKTSAFVVPDVCERVYEIVDAGLPLNMNSQVFINESMLLNNLHTNNIDRALRLLEVCIGHGAVQCILTPHYVKTPMGQMNDAPTMFVGHMEIDWNTVLWLSTLKITKITDFPTTLPFGDTLKMCYGQPIPVGGSAVIDTSPPKCLQWYNPSCAVIRATEDGGEKQTYTVFEMELVSTKGQNSEPAENDFFIMDNGVGWFHTLRIFEIEDPVFSQDVGFAMSSNTKLVLTSQLHPQASHTYRTFANANLCTRKRKRLLYGSEGSPLRVPLFQE